jgi:hypothetical protein
MRINPADAEEKIAVIEFNCYRATANSDTLQWGGNVNIEIGVRVSMIGATLDFAIIDTMQKVFK